MKSREQLPSAAARARFVRLDDPRHVGLRELETCRERWEEVGVALKALDGVWQGVQSAGGALVQWLVSNA